MKQLKPLPKFKSEDEERQFWDTHTSVEYLDWSKAENINFPDLQKTEKSDNVK